MPARLSLEDLLIDTIRTAKEWLRTGRPSDGGAVSHVRLATLQFIAGHGDASMKDLAAHLGIARPSATLLADAMAARGLVRRSSASRDRRSVTLALTPKGRKALAAGLSAIRAKIRALLRPLTGPERAILERMLRRLASIYASKTNHS